MATFKIKENDTLPKIRATLSDSTGPIDLTNADTIRFIMSAQAEGGTPKVNGVASVVGSPVNGEVEYQWASGDTDLPGTYKSEWEITFTDTNVLTVPNDQYDEIVITADLNSD